MKKMPRHCAFPGLTLLAIDVNVLVYAHRRESPQHQEYANWLTAVAEGPAPFGLSDAVCAGFVRVVTHPALWKPPSQIDAALAFIEALRARTNFRQLVPGARNWPLFAEICRRVKASGKLVADAHHAALAIEHGCEWLTADGDFSRFTGLRSRHPLAGPVEKGT